jgi:HSP20 family protein
MNERLEKRDRGDFEVPRVDVWESEAELLLLADLPGVPADAVDVRFDDGELTIEGRRAKGRVYRRVFALSDGFDLDKVAARHEGGVLELRLPKAAHKRTRKIEVRAG